ncbi:MMPL family transporter [Galactobacter caseinivorans]|uniref:MMPL family transporter n=1 Tax=Galactobacter caseinivorans TaxID=2676123 RepID=UPI001F468118|nr:efflux RND transporter permease subunit [Galactobacter caseinivorans]
MADHVKKKGTKGAILRAVGAVLLIVAWLGVMGVGGPTFGKIGDVQTTDQTTFLPSSAEATRAVEWQNKFSDTESIPAIIIVESDQELSKDSGAAFLKKIQDTGLVEGKAVGPIPSEDGKAFEYIVPLSAAEETKEAVAQLRELSSTASGDGTFAGTAAIHVTGAAGFTGDLVTAFGGIDGTLLIVALLAVLVILLIVYRSVLLPITVLLTSMAALCAAIVAVYLMAKNGIIDIDGQSQGILSILVIGAATDYSLLLVARFREAIAEGEDRWAAVKHAWLRSVEPILASGGTVVVGLLCLMFSDLNSNKALGPIAASGIVFSVIAALTLLPALLWLFGRAAFWPFMPKPAPTASSAEQELVAGHGLWGRLALWVRRHHRVVWVATALVLLVGCAGVFQLKASGVPESELVLGQTDSKAGNEAIARHFDAGAGSPAQVYALEADQAQVLKATESTDGVASAYIVGQNGGPVTPKNAAKVVEGRVQISATLSDSADSEAALGTIATLRTAVHDVDSETLVGGSSATALDKQTTAQHDVQKIIPIVLVAILIILMLLLRSVVAPLVLIVTTVLSYGTAMGVSAWIFNGVFNFPGADPAVPLFGFTFLVALGVDYNIFLMSRVREEVKKRGAQDGLTRGLAVTGGVITSAGVVLAATFAALGVVPIMFMVQLGFIVAFGVLLDTLVVRTLLVPALGHTLGRAMWWPSKLARGEK